MGILDERVAVVTGGAQGIGARYASALAKEGATVVVADIQLGPANDVAAAINSAGGRATALSVDVSDKSSTLELAAKVAEQFGRADVLVNNAAIYHSMRRDSQMTVDIEYWRKVFSVNVDGPLLMTQAIAPLMIERTWGRIINQTSTGAYKTGTGHYTTTKTALLALSRNFARELGPHGITVNCIAPGPIWTDATKLIFPEEQVEAVLAQQCIPRRATPDDLTGTLLYLCGEGASWVTGQTLLVDGGATMRL